MKARLKRSLRRRTKTPGGISSAGNRDEKSRRRVTAGGFFCCGAPGIERQASCLHFPMADLKYRWTENFQVRIFFTNL